MLERQIVISENSAMEYGLEGAVVLSVLNNLELADYSDVGRYRASAGLSIQWLSPMGPMIFSFARSVREEEGDDLSFFSFNIGKTF